MRAKLVSFHISQTKRMQTQMLGWGLAKYEFARVWSGRLAGAHSSGSAHFCTCLSSVSLAPTPGTYVLLARRQFAWSLSLSITLIWRIQHLLFWRLLQFFCLFLARFCASFHCSLLSVCLTPYAAPAFSSSCCFTHWIIKQGLSVFNSTYSILNCYKWSLHLLTQ